MLNQSKNRPVRQFSMRSETPTLEFRRNTLKKQFSQDIPDKKTPETRNIQSAKVRTKIHNDSPPEIKLAWSEDMKAIQEACKTEESMVVKKCKEVKRPLRTDLNKDSILHSRQELADRLRQVWKEREGAKQNLNIFLTHTTNEEPESPSSAKEKPKIILPLRPLTDDVDLKNAFQKQIRKTQRNSATPSPRIPLKNETPPISVVLRPNTAACRRDSFQKRANSAFNGSITAGFRNPFARTASLPAKNENKPKFVATKRRLKSARRHSKTTEESSEQKVASNFPMSCDIVTMVSLLSNSESEADEEEEEEEEAKGAKKEDGSRDLGPGKTVKTVSFQQSTIHAVRSFSASFPGRRAPFFLKDHQKMQEKRATCDAAQDDEENTAKRRLLRAGSRVQGSFENLSTPSESSKTEDSALSEKQAEGDKSKPQLDTQKEKQCWDLYKKMSEKGVSVSFDTILRGMLTPTEYRLHRKQSLVEQDNC